MELQYSLKAMYSFEALQTAWHAWTQAHLDPTLKRGIPAKKTQREHLTTQEYKRLQDRLAEERKELEEANEALACRWAAPTRRSP
ncbi:hypothetical protein [Microvirga sp. KLBC 81]|uniref:hypothetical protein n=1 Tax=Microvirga sp. KLBC 81 TaxID=1862707 RepID=UPI00140307A2|nr:hypothetical protein [Microvirga sp. KLBC 81]